MSVESRFFNLPPIIKWPFEVEHLGAIMLLSKAPDLRYGDDIPMPTRLVEHVGPPAFLVPATNLRLVACFGGPSDAGRSVPAMATGNAALSQH